MAKFISQLSLALAILSDWLLIVLGSFIVVVALWSVDVASARYFVIAAGVLLAGFGFWFRSRRLKKKQT